MALLHFISGWVSFNNEAGSTASYANQGVPIADDQTSYRWTVLDNSSGRKPEKTQLWLMFLWTIILLGSSIERLFKVVQSLSVPIMDVWKWAFMQCNTALSEWKHPAKFKSESAPCIKLLSLKRISRLWIIPSRCMLTSTWNISIGLLPTHLLVFSRWSEWKCIKFIIYL